MKKYSFKYIKKFGLKIWVLQVSFLILNKFNIFHSMKRKLSVSKNNEIMKFLSKNYLDIIKNYNNNCSFANQSNIIWIFWWQGFEQCPEIVKKCVESMKKNCSDKQIIMIDKNNISEYYNAPQYILDNLENGKITLIHFSDILRMNLLNKYGGFWVDSTIFFSDNPFDSEKFDNFYTVKFECNDSTSISNGKWCGFFIGGCNQKFYDIMCILFNEYWKKIGAMIDYFLIDYFIKLCYENDEQIKNIFDNVDYNNQNIHKLQNLLPTVYNERVFDELKKENKIHKLSYKIRIDNNENNFYSHIFK